MTHNGNVAAAARVTEPTSSLVERAAAILREEIAAATPPGRGAAPRSHATERESVRLVSANHTVKDGEAVEIVTRLQNDDDGESAALPLSWTDLVADPARRIPSSRISVTPAIVRLPAGGARDVAVRIDVPPGTLPGLYRGLLHAVDFDDLWIVLTLRIG